MIKTLSLQLALVLPGIPDEQDSCIARLSALLQTTGLDKVHVVRLRSMPGSPATSCLKCLRIRIPLS